MHCLFRFHKIADLDGGWGGGGRKTEKLNKMLTEIEIILQNLIGTGPKMAKLKEILSRCDTWYTPYNIYQSPDNVSHY